MTQPSVWTVDEFSELVTFLGEIASIPVTSPTNVSIQKEIRNDLIALLREEPEGASRYVLLCRVRGIWFTYHDSVVRGTGARKLRSKLLEMDEWADAKLLEEPEHQERWERLRSRFSSVLEGK